MPMLPWTTGTAPGPEPAEAVVLGSRLELRSYRDVVSFLRAAMRVRTQVQGSTGALGVSLIAQPLRKTFWTLSAWSDQAALDAFVRTAPHTDVMHRYHDRMNDAAFTTWTRATADLPHPKSNATDLWGEAKQRLAAPTEGEAV